MSAYSPLGEGRQAKLLRAARKAAKVLEKCRGVTGIGIGYAVRKGSRRDEIALVVKVKEKLPLSRLPRTERVPRKIGDLYTDVIEAAATPLASPSDRFDPLVGGIQIQTGLGLGTLGCLVFDDQLAFPFGLTARHVVLTPFQQPNQQLIGQPTLVTSGMNERIGVLGRSDLASDSALIVLDGNRKLRTGLFGGLPDLSRGARNWPWLGMPVSKAGAKTGTTFGTVVFIQSDGKRFDIVPDRTRLAWPKRFGEPGDSGSVVVESATGRVLGLLVLSGTNAGSPDVILSASSWIAVSKALGVFVYDGAAGVWARSPARIGGAGTVLVIAPPNTEAQLRVQYPSGRISSAKGLGRKRADANGLIRWTWTIGTSTARRPGTNARALVQVGNQARETSFALGGVTNWDR